MSVNKSWIEQLFGDKGPTLLAVALTGITVTSFVTFFAMRDLSARQTLELNDVLTNQRAEFDKLLLRLDEVDQGATQWTEVDRALSGIQAQLDIMRRDSAASQAELSRVSETLKVLMSSVDHLRSDPKLDAPTGP